MNELALIAEQRGTGFTGCLLGDPVGAAGVVVHDNGIGEVWALFSPEARALRFQLYKQTKRCLDRILKIEKPKKLLVVVRLSDDLAVNFVNHLGFKFTGDGLFEREV